MKQITSLNNATAKWVKSLQQSKYRKKYQSFILDDWQCLKHLDKWVSKHSIQSDIISMISDQLNLDHSIYRWVMSDKQYPYKRYHVSHQVMLKISCRENSSGIVAVIPEPEARPDKISNGPIFLLDQIEKPGNIGAIMRTCAAMGVETIILYKCKTDRWNHNICRSSVGACFHINTLIWDLNRIQALLNKRRLITCSAPKESQSLQLYSFSKHDIIVFGSENCGISPEIQSLSNESIHIPMLHLDSMNVSVCAAMVAYELSQQKLI